MDKGRNLSAAEIHFNSAAAQVTAERKNTPQDPLRLQAAEAELNRAQQALTRAAAPDQVLFEGTKAFLLAAQADGSLKKIILSSGTDVHRLFCM